MEGPTLLHNMSTIPKAVIAQKSPQSRFRSVVFRLPPDEADLDPAALLGTLDHTRWIGTPEKAEHELRRRLDEHAVTLPYPAAVLVSDRAVGADDSPSDLLTVCTVLAKSSSQVCLRDKEPNLASIRQGRVVVLQIPNQDVR